MLKKQANCSLHYIDDIPEYKQAQRPNISPMKQKIIHQKLETEKQVKQCTNKRIKKYNDFFMNYTHNPVTHTCSVSPHSFSIKQEKDKSYKKSISHRKQKRHGNLIKEVCELTDQNKILKKIEKEREKCKKIQPLLNSALNVSSQINYNLKVKTVSPRFQLQKFRQKIVNPQQKQHNRKISKDKVRQKSIQNNIQQKQDKICCEQNDQVLSLDQILDIKQQNILLKGQQQKLNIFQIINDDTALLNNKQMLQKYSFDMQSEISKYTNNNMKTQVYRDLSYLGRNLIKPDYHHKYNVTDYLNSAQLICDVYQLNYWNLMNVASGRLNPQYVSQFLFDGGKKTKADNNSESSYSEDQQDIEINYRDQIQSNMGINWSAADQDLLQIENYKRQELKTPQNKLLQKYDNLISRMSRMMQKKSELYEYRIKDQKTIINHQDNIRNNIKSIFGKDQYNDIDRYIRMSKVQKTKSKALQHTKCIQLIDLKQNQDQKLAKAISESCIQKS